MKCSIFAGLSGLFSGAFLHAGLLTLSFVRAKVAKLSDNCQVYDDLLFRSSPAECHILCEKVQGMRQNIFHPEDFPSSENKTFLLCACKYYSVSFLKMLRYENHLFDYQN